MFNVITKLTISLKFISASVKINRKLSCFILMTQTFKNSLGKKNKNKTNIDREVSSKISPL